MSNPGYGPQLCASNAVRSCRLWDRLTQLTHVQRENPLRDGVELAASAAANDAGRAAACGRLAARARAVRARVDRGDEIDEGSCAATAFAATSFTLRKPQPWAHCP